MKANIGSITHEESLIQPQPAGNCLNWVLGHIIVSRGHLLRALGAQPVWDEETSKPYQRHQTPLANPDQAVPLPEIWTSLQQSLDQLKKAASKLTAEQLAQKAPSSPDYKPDATWEYVLAVNAFHDAYHAGQTGILRRLIGKPPADL
jgi:hypothetical protein